MLLTWYQHAIAMFAGPHAWLKVFMGSKQLQPGLPSATNSFFTFIVRRMAWLKLFAAYKQHKPGMWPNNHANNMLIAC